MKLNIGRVRAIRDKGNPFEMNISLQVGKNVSYIMQVCGIQSLRSELRRTLGSTVPELVEVRYFDNAPQELLSFSDNVKTQMVAMLASFGITEVTLVEEEGDLDNLKKIWEFVLGRTESGSSDDKSVDEPDGVSKSEEPVVDGKTPDVPDNEPMEIVL